MPWHDVDRVPSKSIVHVRPTVRLEGSSVTESDTTIDQTRFIVADVSPSHIAGVLRSPLHVTSHLVQRSSSRQQQGPYPAGVTADNSDC
jgi:hypothetical protein